MIPDCPLRLQQRAVLPVVSIGMLGFSAMVGNLRIVSRAANIIVVSGTSAMRQPSVHSNQEGFG